MPEPLGALADSHRPNIDGHSRFIGYHKHHTGLNKNTNKTPLDQSSLSMSLYAIVLLVS
jgi:hypothetical protein